MLRLTVLLLLSSIKGQLSSVEILLGAAGVKAWPEFDLVCCLPSSNDRATGTAHLLSSWRQKVLWNWA